ncbi:hypothetical protein [Synechococcus sp. CC9605]|uniref:hypothetical protein n=1 Tax=Synechococcus sp. (strain CC9605) TaxID=110662 RepID=UPI0002E6DD25|nr:hypothetical protein [Synechococcus sp. CC9605]
MLKDVPNGDNAFWSLTVYDKDGFPVGENFNVNSAFAEADVQGEVTLHFGGDNKQPNYLEIYPGWNATLPPSGSTNQSPLISMVRGFGLSWSSNESP